MEHCACIFLKSCGLYFTDPYTIPLGNRDQLV
jgi:hypothetical protein